MIRTREANIKKAISAYKYNYKLLKDTIDNVEKGTGSIESVKSAINRLWQLDFEIYFHPILKLEDKIRIYE